MIRTPLTPQYRRAIAVVTAAMAHRQPMLLSTSPEVEFPKNTSVRSLSTYCDRDLSDQLILDRVIWDSTHWKCKLIRSTEVITDSLAKRYAGIEEANQCYLKISLIFPQACPNNSLNLPSRHARARLSKQSAVLRF